MSSHEQIDLILLDSLLPDGSGRDLLIFLDKEQKLRGWKKIPVISMSGNSIPEQHNMYQSFDILAYSKSQ